MITGPRVTASSATRETWQLVESDLPCVAYRRVAVMMMTPSDDLVARGRSRRVRVEKHVRASQRDGDIAQRKQPASLFTPRASPTK